MREICPNNIVNIDAAPLECARQPPAISSGKRLRRRGPRSKLAVLRRSVPKRCRTLPDMSPGESGDVISEFVFEDQSYADCNKDNRNQRLHVNSRPKRKSSSKISILTVNIRCLLKNLDQLIVQLELYLPHILLIQETWLSASTEFVDIPGYVLVSRRDRKSDTGRGGGIATYQRHDFNGLVHITNCDDEERSWYFLRLDMETVLVANWYRPPGSDHDKFERLYSEVAEYYQEVTGIFISGDLNVHHSKWLKFSNGNTGIGQDLQDFCQYYGLVQLVREPTRDKYLLDLALTDVANCSVDVLPYIADHKMVMSYLPLPEVLETNVPRDVWVFAKADWSSLSEALGKYNWANLEEGSAEDALAYFLEILWLHLVKFIPRKSIVTRKSTHPWLNEKCKEAVLRKNRAEGTGNFGTECENCNRILNVERAAWVQRTKDQLAALPRSSKKWWRLNRQLMRRRAAATSIPVLKDGAQWLTDAKSKADAFARVLSSKSQLPDECVDTPFFGSAPDDVMGFIPFRNRSTKNLFKKLDVNKATGNDKISALILKRLADVLAIPFTKIVRRLFYQACWPSAWKYHLLVPIFKKGAAFLPGNYRGVHLTTVLSKVAERLLGIHLVPYLRRTAFGENQWAFTAGLSSRDLVTMLMMSWILAICSGKKVGAFLSDISGAFDKVFKPYLLAKLQGYGVGPEVLNFLDAYLAPRIGQVCVQGVLSEIMSIANSVYQGTVMGPPLWNSFFADVAVPARSTGGEEGMFADDLNVFQQFDQRTPLVEIKRVLVKCRDRVHTWGKANRVSFDAAKEHFLVLHPSEGSGPAFKLLGPLIDSDLRMHSCIDQILSKARAKITAILRMRGFYNEAQLINQFKTHVWSLLEMDAGAIFHAASSLLEKLDEAQNRFLRAIDITPEHAFLQHNFAPPKLRRNMAMLGMLHKRVLGKCHPSFARLLPWFTERFPEGRGHGHNKALYGHNCEITHCQGLFSRSIFAMVDIYNNLPQHVVDNVTVSEFQSYLNHLAYTRCQQGDVSWSSSFCRRTQYGINGVD